MRIIGDIHGHFPIYNKIREGCEYSIQVGDLGFNYDGLSEVDSTKHRFIHGNHDHPSYQAQPHYLGKYGVTLLDNLEFFFVSGAWSIDYKYRKEYINWWKTEELTYRELVSMADMYLMVKPEIVISHSPPQFIYDIYCDPNFANSCNVTPEECKSRTAYFLHEIWREHQPKYWFFGHLHKNIEDKIGKTNFWGINQYNFVDFSG